MTVQELKKKRIAVIFGGPSSEREISARSAENVYKALKAKKYDAVKVELDMNIAENLKKEKIGFAYIMLHGSPGEDGTVQGLLDLINIPYCGSGVLGSAAAINKIITKQLFIANNIPTPDFIIINGDIQPGIADKPGFPALFKPYAEGSSIGIVKFDSKDEMNASLPGLIRKYKHGLIEKFIPGKEVTVGVLDDEGEAKALPILELKPKTNFYDFKAKYTKGMTEFICPAALDENLTARAKELAVRSHKVLWCHGVSRVDMIISGEDIFVLEVNTIPGMTELSDLPAEALAMGMDFNELVEKILVSGLKKYE